MLMPAHGTCSAIRSVYDFWLVAWRGAAVAVGRFRVRVGKEINQKLHKSALSFSKQSYKLSDYWAYFYLINQQNLDQENKKLYSNLKSIKNLLKITKWILIKIAKQEQTCEKQVRSNLYFHGRQNECLPTIIILKYS